MTGGSPPRKVRPLIGKNATTGCYLNIERVRRLVKIMPSYPHPPDHSYTSPDRIPFAFAFLPRSKYLAA
jgi:hypothetical protein